MGQYIEVSEGRANQGISIERSVKGGGTRGGSVQRSVKGGPKRGQ